MAVGSRHIRHDWNTFVDWEQKSVRTLCGSTTKRHLAGIPGVSEQPEIVQGKDKKLWGWCMVCVRGLRSNEEDLSSADPRIVALHREAHATVKPQYEWWLDAENKRRWQRLAVKPD